MRISVITVAYNAADTIEDTLKSVAAQTYSEIEHIVVDGCSTDETMDIVRRFRHVRWISEADDGLYDAMNKGLAMVTGDVIGFLNADDVFADEGVLARVAVLMSERDLDICFADVVYKLHGRVVRRYSSARFRPTRLRFGWMPAHPTCYVRKAFFDKIGNFSKDYEIAADYEWMVRAFMNTGVVWQYIPEIWVDMRMGGVSTRGIRNRWLLNREIVRACRVHGINTNLAIVMTKFPLKIMELWRK